MAALPVVIELEHSTGQTITGPSMHHESGVLDVRYDFETAEGLVWTTLRFRSVLGTRFTADSAVSAWMLDGYSRVCEVPDSEWIASLIANAREGDPRSARHFFVYFDDAGCVEVAAATVEVSRS